MTLAKLKSFFPSARHADIDQLYARFRERHDPSGRIPRFIRYLNQKGVLKGRALRDLLTLGDVSVMPLDGDASDFRQAQRKRGRYMRIGVLGKGAMGEVHIANDEDLHRTVAVKRIHPGLADADKATRRFYTEAQITAQLDHPSIVPVYSFEADRQGAFSYAMKLVRGETLTEFLADTRAQLEADGVDEDHSLAARLELFLAVCAALAYAHSRGVIHRDLKPDNIMVGAYAEVLVMDWGIARVLDAVDDDDDDSIVIAAEGRAHETQAGAIIGTPQYMAPEQAMGESDAIGPASDQYALGLILYELACLKPAIPAAKGPAVATVVKAAEGFKEPIRAYPKASRIPRELSAIIDKATAREIGDRYPSVGALAADVRRFLQNDAVEVRPDGPLQRLARWVSKNRTKALSIMFALILLGAGLGLFMFLRGQAALELEREASDRREQALMALSQTVGARALEVDAEFDRYEELLTGMVFAAELALSEPAPAERPVWMCDRFSKPGGAPPDLAPSAIYDKDISVRELCQELAPGVDAAAVAPRTRQVARLSHAFFRAKLESHAQDALDLPRARQEALIRNDGVPAAYTYMGTQEGILATYPGRDTKRTDYDPRKRPWYDPPTKRRGPVWIATDSLSDLSGLLLTCAMAVRDPNDQLLAVAAVDLEFKQLIEAFLEQPDIDAKVETYFLTSKGEVIVHSSLRELAAQVKDHTPDPFPFPELLDRFASDAAGHRTITADGVRKLVIWRRIATTRWTYVVVGDDAALLGGSSR